MIILNYTADVSVGEAAPSPISPAVLRSGRGRGEQCGSGH